MRLVIETSPHAPTFTRVHGTLSPVSDRDKVPGGPPPYGWAVAILCFGVALVLIAVLLYATHPEWF